MGERITLNDRRLTKKQVSQLITNGATLDEDVTRTLNEDFSDVNVYKNIDGNYLFVFKDYGLKGKGDIWPKDYIEKLVSKIKYEKTRPFLKGLSNVGHWYHFSKAKENFSNKIFSEIDRLFKGLNLSSKDIDYSYESLDLISKQLNILGSEVVESEFYDGIVAYLGEILIRKIDGNWRFESNPGSELPIIPLIGTAHKWVWYDPITPIWTDLIDVTGFNLRKNLISEIRSKQFDRNIFLK